MMDEMDETDEETGSPEVELHHLGSLVDRVRD